MQRMQSPYERHQASQPIGRVTNCRLEKVEAQHAPHDAQQEPRREDMNGDVADVVARRIAPSDAIIQRQREIHERPAGGADFPLWIERPAQLFGADRRPQSFDGRVFYDDIFVVEDERGVDRSTVNRRDRDRQDDGRDEHDGWHAQAPEGAPPPSRPIDRPRSYDGFQCFSPTSPCRFASMAHERLFCASA